jgi:hypothetical protein
MSECQRTGLAPFEDPPRFLAAGSDNLFCFNEADWLLHGGHPHVDEPVSQDPRMARRRDDLLVNEIVPGGQGYP